MLKKIFYKNKGFRVYKGKISMLAQVHSVFKENVFLNEHQLIKNAQIMETYLNALSSRPEQTYDNCRVLNHDSILNNVTDRPFYKYISRNTLNHFILKGKFRLGSIGYYQNTKNKNIQDLSEGFTHLAINYNNRQIVQAFYSGFNYLIFCGSYISPQDPQVDYLKKNFGECVIKIKHPKSFMSAIAKHINATATHLHSVNYEPIKVIQTTKNELLTKIDGEITSELFDLIHANVTLPSIFLKPTSYDKEHEMRYAFRMKTDQEKPVDIHNLGLLDHIEILEK